MLQYDGAYPYRKYYVRRFMLPPAYAVEVMFSSCLCVCVCVCVCLSVCLSVRAITFEPVDIETSFLVWCYILTSLSIKVIRSRSRSSHGKCQFCYLDISLTYFELSEVKVISRSRSFQGQIVSV